MLQWSTESEIGSAGFNLYSAASADGPYEKINDVAIPAEGSPTEGASYEFIDEDASNRKTYYYRLEEIDMNGVSTFHGPVSAMSKFIFGNK